MRNTCNTKNVCKTQKQLTMSSFWMDFNGHKIILSINFFSWIMEGFDIFPLKCLYSSVKLEPMAKKYKIQIKTLNTN